AHEAPPARPLVRDVEAEVPLGEVAEARPADGQDARAEELEADDARPTRAVAPVEFAPGRHQRPEQLLRHREVREYEVAPPGREELAPHKKYSIHRRGRGGRRDRQKR